MTKSLTSFQPPANVDGLYIAQSGTLHCTAILLQNGDLCLYSPVAGLTADIRNSLEALGKVAYLLAPNHYHNKGLREYAAQFPEAKLICSPAAEPRLIKQTGLAFHALDTLAKELPPGARILEPAGLKTGEVWLEISSGADTIWLVTDAFSAPSKPLGTIVDIPKMLSTFPKYGVRNTDVFKAWVTRQIAERAPTLLVPCHGSPVKRPDLGPTLIALLDQHL